MYVDCSSGISGDMTLGALLEIVEEKDYLEKELKKLKLNGYKIVISKKNKNGIMGTHVEVILTEQHEGDHHEHRNILDINQIIDQSTIDEKSKELAKRIFWRVAKAESKVHGKPIEEVHFHEVGAIDSIIDIVGTAILITKLHPDKILASTVHEGHGFIHCAHGKMAVPVPATSEIFADSHVKFEQIDVDTELVTPTGAAIIAELAEEFTFMPAMTIQKIGWGAGTKDLVIPNVLKVYYGEAENKQRPLVVMETNIDDCSAEILGYTSEKLLKAGALDVFYTPIYMKKNRPAYCLTVCCRKEQVHELQRIIFRETTTIGIRYRLEERCELVRELVEVDTPWGKVQGKKVKNEEECYVYPEYESVKELAERENVPLKEVYGFF